MPPVGSDYLQSKPFGLMPQERISEYAAKRVRRIKCMVSIRSNAWFRSDQMHGFDPIETMHSYIANAWLRWQGNR
jgi:hypothetical protein